MRQLANGEKVAPLSFRQGDFWQEFAEDYNRIADRLDKLEVPNRDEEEAAVAT
jgi:hypothetical protein